MYQKAIMQIFFERTLADPELRMYQRAIEHDIKHLREEGEKVAHTIRQQRDDLDFYIDGITNRELAVNALIRAFTEIDYQDDLETGKTFVAPGIVSFPSDSAIFKQIEALDQAKADLLDDARLLDGKTQTFRIDGYPNSFRYPLFALILQAIDCPRLNRRQAYREVREIPTPDKIAFFWAHTKKVLKQTKAQVDKRLQGLEGDNAIADRERLASMPEEETFALVSGPQTHARANLWFNGKPRSEGMRNTPIPLICNQDKPFPEVVPLGPKQAELAHQRNKDRKLEDQPFLTCLPIYRYLAPIT